VRPRLSGPGPKSEADGRGEDQYTLREFLRELPQLAHTADLEPAELEPLTAFNDWHYFAVNGSVKEQAGHVTGSGLGPSSERMLIAAMPALLQRWGNRGKSRGLSSVGESATY